MSLNFLHRQIHRSPNEGGGGTSGTGQASGSGTGGQELQTPPAAGGAASGQEPGAGKSAADLEKIIADLRKENAQHRTENKTLKEFKEKVDVSTQTETEKLQNQSKQATEKLTATEQALRTERTERAIEKAARKLNIVDEEAALAFIGSKVEYDEAGKPTNVETLLGDLVKAKPYLISQANSGSAGNPGRQRDEATADSRLDAAWAKSGRGNNFGRI